MLPAGNGKAADKVAATTEIPSATLSNSSISFINRHSASSFINLLHQSPFGLVIHQSNRLPALVAERPRQALDSSSIAIRNSPFINQERRATQCADSAWQGNAESRFRLMNDEAEWRLMREIDE